MEKLYLLRKPEQRKLGQGITLIQDIQKENSSLNYISFKVIEILEKGVYEEYLEDRELCLIILSGKVTVQEDSLLFEKIGTRDSVFQRIPTDSVYIGKGKTYSLKGDSPLSRVALCYSPARKKLPTKLIQAKDNSTENRGKYQNKRRVHNILPDTLEIAENLLIVEVYTEGGNFSSYPPHKHDQDNLPFESLLEETYYHEINPNQGFVFQRIYTEDRSLDKTMTVEDKNVVLVPKGYHPVGVPDGYSSYYLNVMAGPKRVWKFHNDPAHEWILKRD